ncbi:hypothetical protein KI387_023423, partial [Taxus chinensis]
ESGGSSSAQGTEATGMPHMSFTQLMTTRETPPYMQTVEAVVDTAIASADPLTELTPRESIVVSAMRQQQIDRDHDIAVRLQACLETPRITGMKSVVASPSTTSPGRGHATSSRAKRGKMFHE